MTIRKSIFHVLTACASLEVLLFFALLSLGREAFMKWIWSPDTFEHIPSGKVKVGAHRAVEAVVSKELSGLFTVAEPQAPEMRKLLEAIAARLGRQPLFVSFPLASALVFVRLVEALRLPFPVSSCQHRLPLALDSGDAALDGIPELVQDGASAVWFWNGRRITQQGETW